ncbi:MAG TPA: radical SAM protein [Allosphingosinicella sp.]|jgi:radical SAM superfamily enzyme YgiQ (UPF0313 family)
MLGSRDRTVLLFALRNRLEHNPAVVYKTVYLGETIAVAESLPRWKCVPIDLDVDDESLTSLIDRFAQIPEAILIWCEVHQARLAQQIATLAKQVSPETRILVFGRATAFIPQFFERWPFDAVHVDGDREAAIRAFLAGGSTPDGISTMPGGGGPYVRARGVRLEPTAWPYPTLDRLPLDRYADFTERTHGPAYSKRIAVTVSKGCALACAYCGASQEEGTRDRRRSVEPLLRWATLEGVDSRDALLHLFAPDLFVDQRWIRSFAEAYASAGANFHWRGVTTTRALQDSETVRAAGKNGCRELAIGVEHVRSKSGKPVKSSLEELRTAASLTRDANIKLKGLMMIGYPSQTEDDILYVEDLASEMGMTLRYTGYTPLHHLRWKSQTELDAMSLESYDRRTFYNSDLSKMSPQFFYKRLVANGGYFVPV